MRILRTQADHPKFITLVKLLDADLAIRDGEEHSFYDQFNKLNSIKHVVLLFEDERAVCCGAIKEFEMGSMEIKRMFTMPDHRGRGLAGLVLKELEKWAGELGFSRCILETGIRQPEAIALYKKNGYRLIPNYGQYIGVENSVCFEKLL
ncbi:GNAT family N-acetyltransferase [Zunongwangia sp. H14]|uniref:GNAT family N-acetyltransferase n=1 Tax=Zunongwangia sp. H14 TaxID=3240792 RepID=UPI0035652AD7